MAIARITFLLSACLLCAYVNGAALPNTRILDGEDATTGQYPWVVSTRLDNAHVGVGTIISNRYVITAAHIVSDSGTTTVDASRVTVRVGSTNQFSGGQIIKASAVTIHPSYGNFLYDIAIIQLASTLTWTDKIAQVAYATPSDDPVENSSVSVAGWGLDSTGTSPYKLQSTSLTVLSTAECELEAGYGYSSTMCLSHAENEGVSRGDDGAGVIYNSKLVGTISFAFGSGGTKYPDIASRISYFAEWIDSVVV